jgi:hypothetical protein
MRARQATAQSAIPVFCRKSRDFCGEGVRKIAPTRFEMRKSDFTSKSDLYVLILERLSN